MRQGEHVRCQMQGRWVQASGLMDASSSGLATSASVGAGCEVGGANGLLQASEQSFLVRQAKASAQHTC